jgi:allophanate hydrolase
LLRVTDNGCSIEVEIWKMPMERFGDFVAGIPAPLSFGKIELKDGEKTEGFLCEAYACRGAEDISRFGGWRAYVKSI